MSIIHEYRKKVSEYEIRDDRELFTLLSCVLLFGEEGIDIVDELGMITAKKLYHDAQGFEWDEDEEDIHSLALFALFQLFKTEY